MKEILIKKFKELIYRTKIDFKGKAHIKSAKAIPISFPVAILLHIPKKT